MRSNRGWRRHCGASCRSSSKPWPTSLDTCMHSNTHAHDPEGIGYHFPGIGQYLNTSSGWNPLTHKMNQLHFQDIFGPAANCRRIEITIGLPSDGWKFGLAMRGNPLAGNELAFGFPRSLISTGYAQKSPWPHTESPWPLHFKHSHWWKRWSRSKFVASHYAWGTNGVYKWMHNGCKVHMDSYLASTSNRSFFMVTRDYYLKPPLGYRLNTKTLGDRDTPDAHHCWFNIFNYVWRSAWIEFIEIALGWGPGHIRLHFTLEGPWPHYMLLGVCWNGLWTLSFELSQFHGHGSWLVLQRRPPAIPMDLQELTPEIFK